MTSDEAFTRIEVALGAPLEARGFTQEKAESHPGGFGGRYAQYGNGTAALRLTWDGKESHLVLECDRLPNETKAGPWLDLLLMRCDPRSTEAEACVSALGDEFAQALEGYIEQWTRK